MADSPITWTVTAAHLIRTGCVAADQVSGQVRAAVLELAPQMPDPDLSLVVQVGAELGRLYPGRDEVGGPDPVATTAACDYLLGELLDTPARS